MSFTIELKCYGAMQIFTNVLCSAFFIKSLGKFKFNLKL